MRGFLRVCKYCKKEFHVDHKNRGTYCSPKCSGLGRSLPIGENILRRCVYCEQEYPATEIYFCRREGKKLKSYCRKCDNEKGRDCHKTNPEKEQERSRRYYAENKQIVLAKTKKWGDQHPDKRRRATKDYRERNPGKDIKDRQERRTRASNLPATFTVAEWKSCLKYWNYSCAYCGKFRKAGRTLAQDHFIPLSKGGPYIARNILPACHGIKGCNNKKVAKYPVKWLTEEFGDHKAEVTLARIEAYFEWVTNHIATSSTEIADSTIS